MTDKESVWEKGINFKENFNCTKYLLCILDDIFVSSDVLCTDDMANNSYNILSKI